MATLSHPKFIHCRSSVHRIERGGPTSLCLLRIGPSMEDLNQSVICARTSTFYSVRDFIRKTCHVTHLEVCANQLTFQVLLILKYPVDDLCFKVYIVIVIVIMCYLCATTVFYYVLFFYHLCSQLGL